MNLIIYFLLGIVAVALTVCLFISVFAAISAFNDWRDHKQRKNELEVDLIVGASTAMAKSFIDILEYREKMGQDNSTPKK